MIRFRWVECQLDTLRKCLTIPAIRKALSGLPKTLDETYSRILESIPIEYAREAHTIFQLLSVSYHPLRAETVAEAVVIDLEINEFRVDARLGCCEDILEICGGLVIFVEHHVPEWYWARRASVEIPKTILYFFYFPQY